MLATKMIQYATFTAQPDHVHRIDVLDLVSGKTYVTYEIEGRHATPVSTALDGDYFAACSASASMLWHDGALPVDTIADGTIYVHTTTYWGYVTDKIAAKFHLPAGLTQQEFKSNLQVTPSIACDIDAHIIYLQLTVQVGDKTVYADVLASGDDGASWIALNRPGIIEDNYIVVNEGRNGISVIQAKADPTRFLETTLSLSGAVISGLTEKLCTEPGDKLSFDYSLDPPYIFAYSRLTNITGLLLDLRAPRTDAELLASASYAKPWLDDSDNRVVRHNRVTRGPPLTVSEKLGWLVENYFLGDDHYLVLRSVGSKQPITVATVDGDVECMVAEWMREDGYYYLAGDMDANFTLYHLPLAVRATPTAIQQLRLPMGKGLLSAAFDR